VLEDTPLEIPFCSNHMSVDNFAFYKRTKEDFYSENHFSNAKYVKRNGFVNGFIEIKNLKQGMYTIFLLELGV
jgi:hypothetical protein